MASIKYRNGEALKMSVTVIVPTLGLRPVFLLNALSSILNQTLAPMEMIVVNNGLLKLGDLNLKNPLSVDIKVIDAVAKAGAPQARNIGAAIAKGELLAFLDDDDLWGTTFLENALISISENKADCCLGRIDKLEDSKISSFMDASTFLSVRSFLVMNPGATGSNILIRKDVFRDIGGFDSSICPTEDRGLMVELLNRNYKVCVAPMSQAIMQMHDQERLTVSRTVNLGFRKFHHKYKHLMGFRDRIYSNWLFRNEEFKNRKTIVGRFVLFVMSALIFLIGRRPRRIWISPVPVS